jgi:hypothetical protein
MGGYLKYEAFMQERYGVRDQRDVRPSLRVADLTSHLREGGTLGIDSVDMLNGRVREIAEDLERQLRLQVHVNLYASFGNYFGFGIHSDDHDVMVLQVHGRKEWEIFAQVPEIPLRGEPREFSDAGLGSPVWKGTVEDGDVLYIPRGWPHRATPCGEPVLHLSAGMFPFNGMNLLMWIAEMLKGEPIMRSNLPIYQGRESNAGYLDKFRAVISNYLEKHHELLNEFVDAQDATAAARPKFSLPWSATDEVLPPTRQYIISLSVSRPLQIELSEETNSIDVSCDGKCLSFHESARSLFEYLTKRAPCSETTFMTECSETHSQDELREFIRELVRHGVVFITPEKESNEAPLAAQQEVPVKG